MRRARGFSLIEILVAIAILGMGIVTLFNIFPSAWHSFAYSRVLNRIAMFAQHKLEELKSHSLPLPGETSGTDNDLAWTMKIDPVRFEPGIDLMRVQLDVAFTYQGIEQNERFVTYSSRAH